MSLSAPATPLSSLALSSRAPPPRYWTRGVSRARAAAVLQGPVSLHVCLDGTPPLPTPSRPCPLSHTLEISERLLVITIVICETGFVLCWTASPFVIRPCVLGRPSLGASSPALVSLQLLIAKQRGCECGGDRAHGGFCFAVAGMTFQRLGSSHARELSPAQSHAPLASV